jgi:hypothetical protein
MQKEATPQRYRQQRDSLRGRVRRFYKLFNQRAWGKCFDYLDPRLRQAGKVERSRYEESLARFLDTYGEVKIWHTDLSLHLDATKNKQDPRPFAFVYIFWQDKRHEFHVFRERWVEEAGDWYTRVVGLVTHELPAVEARPD